MQAAAKPTVPGQIRVAEPGATRPAAGSAQGRIEGGGEPEPRLGESLARGRLRGVLVGFVQAVKRPAACVRPGRGREPVGDIARYPGRFGHPVRRRATRPRRAPVRELRREGVRHLHRVAPDAPDGGPVPTGVQGRGHRVPGVQDEGVVAATIFLPLTRQPFPGTWFPS